jgi:hypothetical protein
MTASDPSDRPDRGSPTAGPDAKPDNRQVLRWRRPAGFLVLVVLIGLCVTTLFRTPNPVWTVVTGALAVIMAGLLLWDFRLRGAGGTHRMRP